MNWGDNKNQTNDSNDCGDSQCKIQRVLSLLFVCLFSGQARKKERESEYAKRKIEWYGCWAARYK